METSEAIRMKVGELTVDPTSKTPIVVLRDAENRLSLPIWIGGLEANAVASELEGFKVSRPQTHDLLTNILQEASIEVLSVAICDIRENTWSTDARPSDAIALALRAKCEIWVAKHVLEQSSMVADEDAGADNTNLSSVEPEKWSEILQDMGPDDFKYKM